MIKLIVGVLVFMIVVGGCMYEHLYASPQQSLQQPPQVKATEDQPPNLPPASEESTMQDRTPQFINGCVIGYSDPNSRGCIETERRFGPIKNWISIPADPDPNEDQKTPEQKRLEQSIKNEIDRRFQVGFE